MATHAKLEKLKLTLKDQPQDHVQLYLDSVKRDIERGEHSQYNHWTIEDYIEDYENYIGDKFDVDLN